MDILYVICKDASERKEAGDIYAHFCAKQGFEAIWTEDGSVFRCGSKLIYFLIEGEGPTTMLTPQVTANDFMWQLERSKRN